MSRSRLASPVVRERVLAELRRGASLAMATSAAGVSRRALSKRCAADPDLAAEVAEARREGAEALSIRVGSEAWARARDRWLPRRAARIAEQQARITAYQASR